MAKRISLNKVWVLFTLFVKVGIFAQNCPTITYPSNGAIDVPVDATITWGAVDGINGYLISMGTTPGGTDLLNREATGINTSYAAPVGLPENTRIYVSLSIIDATAQPVACATVVFTTRDVTTPPPCTFLLAPDNNAANVTVVTELVWQYAPTATNYFLSMGTTEGGVDILDNLNIGNVLKFTPSSNLPQDVRIYVTIRPANENGIAASCIVESFFTGPVNDPCNLIDPLSGAVVALSPEIDFPAMFILCKGSMPTTASVIGSADGFRWYRLDNGREVLLSQGRDFQVAEPGNYKVEAFNRINDESGQIECASTKNFIIAASEPPSIESIDIRQLTIGKLIEVYVSGSGNYEFSLDNENGPYQDSNTFANVSKGPHTVFVRDKNGCGTSSQLIERGFKHEDFPNFFTPNGDGANDFWQMVWPEEIIGLFGKIENSISIFDRYGNYLFNMDAQSRGWDGNFNGRPLPSSDYWFKAIFPNQDAIQGHFTLKR